MQASTVYGHDNRYVADAVRAHPDRFVGVYSIDALAIGRRSADRSDGKRPVLSGFRLCSPRAAPCQASLTGSATRIPPTPGRTPRQLRIPICLQMTMAGLPTLRRLLERFPKVRVLLDHCARPDLSDGAPYHAAAPLFEMASFPGVYLKLTNRTLAGAASGKSQPAQFLQKLVAVFGANRIAWGSNFPAAEGSLRELLTSAQSGLSLLSPAGSGPDLQRNRANCLPRTRGAPAMSASDDASYRARGAVHGPASQAGHHFQPACAPRFHRRAARARRLHAHDPGNSHTICASWQLSAACRLLHTNRPIVVLPVVVASRFQRRCLIASSTARGTVAPASLLASASGCGPTRRQQACGCVPT